MSAAQLPLRPYQREAVDAVRKTWGSGKNRVAVVLPTGSGKTVLFSHLASEEWEGGGRALVLAHRTELVDQAAAKIAAIAPAMRVGVEMGAREADLECGAVVASVPTMASAKRQAKWPRGAFSVVIVDECHHSPSETYVTVMDHFGCYREGGTRTLGVTATLVRGDGVGLGSVWQSVAYERSVLEMIVEGYLVNPRGVRVQVAVDFSQVRSTGGDYAAGDLGTALTEAGFEQAVVEAYVTHAKGRPGLVFTPTVATAQSAAEALRDAGFRAEAVWGAMDPDDRKRAVEGLRDGSLDLLANCQVLTEGTDIPRAEVAIMARPTKSPGLYAQMAGRVLRPSPEKDDALILDLVGITADHRLCTLLDLAEGQVKKKSETERPEDGETLTEAVERITKVKLGTASEVNLFRSSRSVWLATEGGHWFVPAAGGQVFLREWPTRNGWSIGWMPRAGEPVPLGRAPDDLALAMALGEEHAARADRAAGGKFSAASRGASWRGREPSPNQLGAAAKMRVEVPPGATAGEVSDLISVAVATRRIDRFFARRGA